MNVLFEGPVAYAVQKRETFRVMVYSTNSVRHIEVGTIINRAQAERLCARLNRYPRNVREAYRIH